MKVYKYSKNELISVIARCYLEADQGRCSLAVARLQELNNEFPDHPNILYALGQIHRDNLGSGLSAYKYIEKAYECSIQQGSKSDTAWFSICNLVQMSPTENDFRKWTDIAFRTKGNDKDECKGYALQLKKLDEDTSYHSLLVGECITSGQREDYGVTAALVEIALQQCSDMANDSRFDLIKMRMMCLRQLDEIAANQRSCLAEHYPSDERITLIAALEECAKALELDPYEASLWNYRSAWCLALGKYDDCIRYADKAIEIRPSGYPRPHINKSSALREKGDFEAALASAKEALAQAPACGLGPEVVEQSRHAVSMCASGPRQRGLKEMIPTIKKFETCAIETSGKDIERFRGALDMDSVVNRLITHLGTNSGNPHTHYVSMMSELLMMFTPETAFAASLQVFQRQGDQPIVEYCISSSIYLACSGTGCQARDATRYLALMTLFFGNPEGIRRYYRQAFLAVSDVARGPLRNADSFLRAELLRIDPCLPSLIADQEPISDEDREVASRNIAGHFDSSVSSSSQTLPQVNSATSVSKTTNFAGSLIGRFLRLFRRKARDIECETCSNRMTVLDFSGSGSVMLSMTDVESGIGHAEQCWECDRLYCADCYPTRPPNTCICGKGRNAIRQIGGTTYKGSLRLVKVKYTNKGAMPEGRSQAPSKKLDGLISTITELRFSHEQITALCRTLEKNDPELLEEFIEYVQRNQIR